MILLVLGYFYLKLFSYFIVYRVLIVLLVYYVDSCYGLMFENILVMSNV